MLLARWLAVLCLNGFQEFKKQCAEFASMPLSAPIQVAAVFSLVLLAVLCFALDKDRTLSAVQPYFDVRAAADIGAIARLVARLTLAGYVAHQALVVAVCMVCLFFHSVLELLLAECGKVLKLLLAALWAVRVALRQSALLARLVLKLLLRLLALLDAAGVGDGAGGVGAGDAGAARPSGGGGGGGGKAGACSSAPCSASDSVIRRLSRRCYFVSPLCRTCAEAWPSEACVAMPEGHSSRTCACGLPASHLWDIYYE
jgi:hypothetical protein